MEPTPQPLQEAKGAAHREGEMQLRREPEVTAQRPLLAVPAAVVVVVSPRRRLL